ncbi:hypothetical protein ABTY98_36590 [Streptomyces sp. NPDC096040]|uniref:hypothetical protein n=1 Tax=Streptomyces sp. NPDC096040 TaxID=3155541 RepID=UPI003317E401
MPLLEIPETAATICAVITGVLNAELSGALNQWANLKPPTVPTADEDGHRNGPDEDHVFRLVLDTLITGLEGQHPADP